MTEPGRNGSASQESDNRRIRWKFVIPILTIGLVLAVFVGFFATGGMMLTIPSDSMSPTYPAGARIFTTAFGSPQRGQAVVLKVSDPTSAFAHQLRRIVAIGGDTVSARDGRLIVNGEPAEEPYLAEGVATDMPDQVKVPKGSVFVLGDNRPISFDSRSTGPVSSDLIEGYVRFSI